MREEVELVRRRQNGIVVHETAGDLIAAEYRHTTARGVAGAVAPDPQLHSHVVISGVVRQDGQIAAVASRPIFRAAREVGAYYRAALAWELRERGYAIEQATGNRDRYFELAGVPESLREAFSQRAREFRDAVEAVPREVRAGAGARRAAPPEARGPPGQAADDASRSRPRVARDRRPARVRRGRGGVAALRPRPPTQPATLGGSRRGAPDRTRRDVRAARTARDRVRTGRRRAAPRPGPPGLARNDRGATRAPARGRPDDDA